MNINAIPEIRVESAGDEVAYELPVRPLGMLRLAGLIPIGFSALWCGGVGSVVVSQFPHLTSHPQSFDYFVCAFLLCFMIPGFVPAGFGLLILFGHCRVRWRNAQLSVSERVGPFGWPRRMPRQPIRKFIVMGGGTVAGERPLPGLGTLASLSANFDNGVSRMVVTGYPRAWLEAIAQDLSARAGLAQSSKPPSVEIYQGPAPALAVAITEKPDGSPVVMQRRDASVVLEVPPAGLWKGSRGLFTLAIFWCLVMVVFTAAFFFGGQFELEALPIIAVFWLLGLGMLSAAINLGRRRSTFTAGPSELTVVKSGPFGTKRVSFPRTDITDVSAGASNFEVNHRRVSELQVHLATGKKAGFLVGRDRDELRWIAMELRNALGLAAPAQPPAPELGDWRYGRLAPQKPATPLGKFLGLVVVVTFALVFFSHVLPNFFTPARVQTPVQPPHATGPVLANPYPSNKPILADPTLVFNAFGPAGSHRPTTTWAVGTAAHAEWFVPTLSGNLSEIILAVEPQAGNRHPGKATIFLTADNHGYPGRTLESFTVTAKETTGLLALASTKKPALQAGVKYWLCARSKGGWSWHFNDQNIVHNSAREVGRNEWASAGDYTYIGAFSIRVSTNQPPAQPAQPVAAGTNDASAP